MVPLSPSKALGTLASVSAGAAVFVLAVAVVVAVGTKLFAPASRMVASRLGVDERLRQLLGRVVGGLSVPVALATGLAAVGMENALLVALAGGVLLTVGVVVAADGLAGDVVGGVLLLVTRPFKRGDWVAFDDVEARVERVGLRTTELRTFDNETVTVPNGLLNDRPVTNRTAQDRLRQTYTFGVDYEEDVAEAMTCVVRAAESVDGVISDPAPTVRVDAIDPSWVTLKARIWLAEPTRADHVDVRSAFLREAKSRLREQDITLNPEVTEVTGKIGTAEIDTDNVDLERPEGDD